MDLPNVEDAYPEGYKFNGDKEKLIYKLGLDPLLAHQSLFPHRHPDETPPFHYEIIRDLHGPHPRVLELAFRGAAKSTIAEEYIIIGACWRRFRNFIIVGESATRACERLASIKHEVDYNDHIQTLFGDLHGPVWNEDKIQLSNGVVIQAFGRGQSLRGTKHDDARPDGCLIDDIEDEDSVNTPEGRDKVQRWVMRTLLPALSPKAVVRVLANMLDPDCLAVRLRKTERWLVREYPWEYLAPDGARTASWPSRFPLSHIDRVKSEYAGSGMLNEYMQEYMVQAVDPSTRAFTSSMFKYEPVVRTWQATYAMYDPARSVKATSAHTGKVVFSWVGTKLIVWEADGQLWMPDAIIRDIFDVHNTYQPIKIGVEKEGLEEFILQPLRAEMTRRRQIVPVITMPAPAGKLAFIRSLQPFFISGEVVFAKELPALQQQLSSFPTGRIDVPNALAYALRMRPGLPVYEGFGFQHVRDDLDPVRNTGYYLVLGATRQFATGVLLQLGGGCLLVLADWVREGDPGAVLDDLLVDARAFAAQSKLTVYAGPEHWNTYDGIGLRAAAGRAMLRLSTAGDKSAGREELRRRLEINKGGHPGVQVSTAARWTLNAFSGGYARSVLKGREITGTADDGIYKTLMEALESFAAVLAGSLPETGDMKPNYAVDSSGRRYLTAMPKHHGQAS